MANQWELVASGSSAEDLQARAPDIDAQFQEGDWGCLQVVFPFSLPWDFTDKVYQYAVARGLQGVQVTKQTGYCYAVVYRKDIAPLVILVACIGAAIVLMGVSFLINSWYVSRAKAEAIKVQTAENIAEQQTIMAEYLDTIANLPLDQQVEAYNRLLKQTSETGAGIIKAADTGIEKTPSWLWAVIAIAVLGLVFVIVRK